MLLFEFEFDLYFEYGGHLNLQVHWQEYNVIEFVEFAEFAEFAEVD